jgi:LysM repeat protein
MSSFLNRKLPPGILALILLQLSIVAQEPVQVQRSANKVILEGTVYYIHTVKPGETLYAISRAYNISQKAIAVENPGVISGIQIGQALKIPVDGGPQEEIDTSELAEPDDLENMHTVKPGETFYGIARFYGLKEEDLRQVNPGVSAEHLSPGQRLLIPEKVEKEEEHPFNEEGLLYHKVKRKETLYSIAAYYQLSIDEIRSVNPELGWGGPKAGQVIRIPAPQLIEKQEAEVEADEDDTSFSEENGLSLHSYDELEGRHENIRRTYRVAFLIPFDFREMEPLDSLLKDVVSETRRNRIIERYLLEERIPQSVQYMEFFQGSLLAVEAMRETGMRLDIRYYDTRRSVVQTSSILQEEDFDEYDLIIGPFYAYNLELVSEFSRRHRIPLVTPFHNSLDLVRDNPYLFQLSPSLEKEYQEAARLVASKHMYNIVYVRQTDSLDLEKHEYFKRLIFDGFDDYHPSEPVVFKEVVQELDRAEELIYSLSPDKKNLVVVPTANEALASTVISSLYFQSDKYDIEVIGSPHWTEFSTIDFRHYHKLKLMFYSSFWVDYHNERIADFMATYRDHYFNEPTIHSRKGINYGILGHDMSYYFLNALREHGRRFILDLDDYHPELVQGPYTFSRISGSGGYENSTIRFYQFQPDMSIQEFEVPDLPQRNYYFRPVEDTRRRYLYRDVEIR